MTSSNDRTTPAPGRRRRRLSRHPAAQRVIAGLVRGAVAAVRAAGPDRSAAMAGRIGRLVAPLVPENRLALANLAAAFPEKSEAERRRILAGVWDNLARTMTEFVHLRDLVVAPDGQRLSDRVEVVGAEHFEALRDDGRPGIIFTAHLGNWELLAVAAEMAKLPVIALMRPPANIFVRADLSEWRGGAMGRLVASRRGAALEVAAALSRGAHLGMVADQRFPAGPQVPFFGQPAASNPIVAKLARHFECPVHGARVIRLPGGRYRLELTPPLDLPRDPDGDIDVPAATALIQSVIEGWVREHPEQWLWLHDRWRLE